MNRILLDITVAFEAIIANKVKTLLTALGIIFGVAAVITMLAIGNGAQQEILNQMKLVGVNNIIVNSVFNKDKRNEEDKKNEQKHFSPGLTLKDANSIKEILPNVKNVCPQIILHKNLVFLEQHKQVKLIGTSNVFFELFNKKIIQGCDFSQTQLGIGAAVCIVSDRIKARIFKNQNPVGKQIKCGNVWLTIVGVVEESKLKVSTKNLGVEGGQLVVYVPIESMLRRYVNRSLVTKKSLLKKRGDNNVTDKVNYNQLDKVIVQVDDNEKLLASKQIIKKILLRRHNKVKDFEIIVPELLLQQQQKTKDIFNMVLGAIAGISLLVGGIGIMNIMLASVMERFKEIGIRMAVGAQKRDILTQFVAEASLVSLSGGIIGVMLGIVASHFVNTLFDITTIISIWSVIISFGISVAIGIVFGYMPARRAASQDPIVSLRSE